MFSEAKPTKRQPCKRYVFKVISISVPGTNKFSGSQEKYNINSCSFVVSCSRSGRILW